MPGMITHREVNSFNALSAVVDFDNGTLNKITYGNKAIQLESSITCVPYSNVIRMRHLMNVDTKRQEEDLLVVSTNAYGYIFNALVNIITPENAILTKFDGRYGEDIIGRRIMVKLGTRYPYKFLMQDIHKGCLVYHDRNPLDIRHLKYNTARGVCQMSEIIDGSMLDLESPLIKPHLFRLLVENKLTI